jgi:hypothetical protein
VKQPHPLLKLAAVVCSVLLAGGFVSYRAGAFHWLLGTSARPADSGSSPAPEESLSDGATEPAPTIMYSTKSMPLSAPRTSSGSSPFLDAAYSLPLQLSDVPDPEPPTASQQSSPAPAQPASTVIMSGTKSFIIEPQIVTLP